MKRRSWRLVVDLIVFTLAAVGLVVYGVVDLLGNPFNPGMQVSAVFPNASGVSNNFTVWLNGVDVGSVSGVHLVSGGAQIDMHINPGVAIPNDVVASIDIANDLGEQVVELTPTRGGTAPDLHSGATVPVASTGIPVEVGQVVASASRLLRAIPAGNLNKLLRELATGLHGRSADLRTIIADSTAFSNQILQYQQQINALLANSPPVLNTVSAVGSQLEQALTSSREILQVVATDRTSVQGDLTNGQAAVGQLGQLTTNQDPDLACLIHDVSALNANLDQPTNLSALSTTLTLSHFFFNAFTKSAEPGLAASLVQGESANPDQTTLRTRLLLPPASPAGDAYAQQQSIPDILPAAGCSTELGQGVGAASQPGFTAAAGGTVVQPTSTQAQVRGGGDPPTGSTTAAPATTTADHNAMSGTGTVSLLIVGCVLGPALFLAWGARPSRRRTRRQA